MPTDTDFNKKKEKTNKTLSNKTKYAFILSSFFVQFVTGSLLHKFLKRMIFPSIFSF